MGIFLTEFESFCINAKKFQRFILKKTIEVWQPRYERPLTMEDAREIAFNTTALVKYLTTLNEKYSPKPLKSGKKIRNRSGASSSCGGDERGTRVSENSYQILKARVGERVLRRLSEIKIPNALQKEFNLIFSQNMSLLSLSTQAKQLTAI